MCIEKIPFSKRNLILNIFWLSSASSASWMGFWMPGWHICERSIFPDSGISNKQVSRRCWQNMAKPRPQTIAIITPKPVSVPACFTKKKREVYITPSEGPLTSALVKSGLEGLEPWYSHVTFVGKVQTTPKPFLYLAVFFYCRFEWHTHISMKSWILYIINYVLKMSH